MKKTNELVYNLFSLIKVSISIHDKCNRIMDYKNIEVPYQLDKIIFSNKKKICSQLKKQENNKVVKLVDPSYLTYIGTKLNGYEVIIGPFLEFEHDSIKLNALKMRLKIVGEDNYIFDDFYNQLVVLRPLNIDFVVRLLHALNGSENMMVEYKNIEGKIITESTSIDSVKSKFRDLDYVKQNYVTEEEFLKVVESGNVEDARQFITDRIMTKLPDRAINDTLRNEKTRLTILNTLCNRAAIKAGVNYQLGHQISTNYGIKIERAKSMYNINKLSKEIIIGYTQTVRDYSLLEYSKLVRGAILNIRKNITEKYSLTDVANDLFVSREHLSRIFKKETRLTVSEYISHSKILEAKKLLKIGEQSVLNISIMLGYTSSSQFSSAFKKNEGISPNQYKSKYL